MRVNKRNIEIDGLDKLIDKLTAIGGNSQKALHSGLMKGGEAVQGEAKETCPTDTGRLKNSIEVTGEKKRKYKYSDDIGSKKKFKGEITGGGQDAVAIGTNVEYAAYVEFGTGQKGDQSVSHRQEWPGQPPRPFLSPALKKSEGQIRDAIVTALKKSIREAVNDG